VNSKRLRFYLDQFAGHKERAMAAYRRGDAPDARAHLLQAARYLAMAAQDSTGKIRENRLAQSKKLLVVARELKGKKAIPTHGQDAGTEAVMDHLIVPDKGGVRFSDIAGLEDVKEQVRIKMIYPFTHPGKAEKFGIKKGGGVLLYGPPGTGKTMMARAVAGEVNATFFVVKVSDILSKWVGEAERNVKALFDAARTHERSVIFIDEFESLATSRRKTGSSVMPRVVAQILTEAEGFHKNPNPILLIGASNEPWSIDPAMMRPGRFDEKVYVGLPDSQARLRMLEMNLEGKPLDDDVDLREIASLLDGYSGADIKNICNKVCALPFVEAVKTDRDRDIQMTDILSVLQETKPSVSKRELKKYEEFRTAR